MQTVTTKTLSFFDGEVRVDINKTHSDVYRVCDRVCLSAVTHANSVRKRSMCLCGKVAEEPCFSTVCCVSVKVCTGPVC